MKTYLIDTFNKIQKFSAKLDNLSTLTNQHWVSIDNISSNKVIYIFRPNKNLLISTNGNVEKARWDYLGNNSLLIETSEKSVLFKHSFVDENFLALKVDNSNEFAVFVNENKFNGELNSIDKVVRFVENKYLTNYQNQSSTDDNINLKSDQNTVISVLFKIIIAIIVIFIVFWLLGYL